jgi:hypothetical protein
MSNVSIFNGIRLRRCYGPIFLIFLLTFPAFLQAKNVSNEASEVAQKKIKLFAYESTKPLSLEEIGEIRHVIEQSRVLEMPRLDKATINALGVLLLRANADHAFQDECAGEYDFQGLWSRIGIDVDPRGYAYLSDQISISRGEKQQYGFILPGPGAPPFTEDQRRGFSLNRNRIGIQLYVPGQTSAELVTPAAPSLAMAEPHYPTTPELRAKLLSLVQMDQAARDEPSHSMTDAESKAFYAHMLAVDAANLPQIQAIFDKYGFPTAEMVGRSGVLAAFLLVQHAIQAPALMSRAATEAAPLMQRGDLPYMNYALLVDRVACVIDHRPQTFGTQGTRIPKSFWYCPIAEPQDVNERRAKLFLEPLSHEQIYGKSPSVTSASTSAS